MAPVPPFLLKTNDNPEGVDQSVFDGIMKAIVEDRPALLFFKEFFNVYVVAGRRISVKRCHSPVGMLPGAFCKGNVGLCTFLAD